MQPKDNIGQSPNPPGGRGISWRAVLLGMILLPANAYFITHLEVVRFQSWPSIFALMMNTLFVLFVLATFNLFLLKKLPGWAFSGGELLTIYIILNIGTVLAGEDLFQVIMYTVTYPLRYAAQDSFAAELVQKYLPHWAIVNDPKVVRDFYYGGSSLLEPRVFRAWLNPVLVWGGVLLVIFWIMLCINVIIRKQWSERERLTFPIVQVPLALVSGPQFFRNKMLWLGFALSSVIALFNGLNVLFPMLPAIIPADARSFAFPSPTNLPWQAMGGLNGKFMPFAVGLAMLMPTDLAFSCWFFFWVQRFEYVVSAVAGFTGAGQPYLGAQAAGVLMGIALFVLWNERRYLGSVLRKALGRASELDDSQEPMSYRTAVFGILLGVAALVILSWQLGLSLRVLGIFLVIYFVIAIGITRLRAELGAPIHDLFWVGPESYMFSAVGSGAFSRRDLSVLSLFYFMRRQYGGHPMPVQLEAYKMGERTGLNQRRLSWVMMLAAVVGTAAAFLVMTGTLHKLGAATSKVYPLSFIGSEQFTYLKGLFETPEPNNPGRLGATFGGMLLAFVLLAIRLRVASWPFHPLGFTLGQSWYMGFLWVSVLVGWLLKVLILRYGGQRAYLRILPVVFGVILGDCVWGMIWLVVGMILNRTTYSVWWFA